MAEIFNNRICVFANELIIFNPKTQVGSEDGFIPEGTYYSMGAMFDAFGNWSNNKPLKKKHLKKIREQGIEIVKFDPFTFPYINHAAHRDHRKIAVIDGKVAYTGGMNIADYYINGLPKIGTWRDMHTRIEGDAVNDLQEIFLTIWNKETKQNVGGAAYFPQHEEQTDSTNIVGPCAHKTLLSNISFLHCHHGQCKGYN